MDVPAITASSPSIASETLPFPRGIRASRHRFLLGVFLLLLGPARGEAVWHNVRGADVRALFIDHELADGVHYAYQFRSDGTFTGFNMGKPVDGAWRIDGNEFCWIAKRRNAQEECFEVKRGDHSVRFLRDGYEALRGKLTPVA